MYLCESQKYDMEFEVRKRDFEVVACPQFWKPVIENLDIQDVWLLSLYSFFLYHQEFDFFLLFSSLDNS